MERPRAKFQDARDRARAQPRAERVPAARGRARTWARQRGPVPTRGPRSKPRRLNAQQGRG
eukprot:8659338-Lingulodinium_polyedra.AAC.1